MSIARLAFPSRLELNSLAGSCNEAPLRKVSFTTDLYDSPVQMMPSCDQTGVPIHFHSSTTSGSASLMSLRIWPSVFPRQSPSSVILFEMRSDADVMGWSLSASRVESSRRAAAGSAPARREALQRIESATLDAGS